MAIGYYVEGQGPFFQWDMLEGSAYGVGSWLVCGNVDFDIP